MRFILIASIFFASHAHADAYKDLQNATAPLDSYYEGVGPHEGHTCQKGREVLDLVVFLPTQEICKLTELRRRCTKWLSKDKKCAQGNWKRVGKEKEIFRGKGTPVGPNDCHRKMEQKVAQLKGKGYDCSSNQYE